MKVTKWHLRNFRKGLRLVEKIAHEEDVRRVDYTLGFAVASIKQLQQRGRITKKQGQALIELAYEVADNTTDEITSGEMRVIDWNITPPDLFDDE